MSDRARSRTAIIAGAILKGSSALLALALLVQAFTAGMAAITDPSWWEIHLSWVHAFQWLAIAVTASGAWADVPRRTKWASAVPLALIGLQYVLAHRGIEGSLPIGLGLHAVNAMVLFAVTARVAATAWDGGAGRT